MNDNTIESIEWHKDQLAKLLSGEDDFYKIESELDSILEKVKTKKKVRVRRGGKTFYREQEVGRMDSAIGPKGYGGDPAERTKKLENTLTVMNEQLKESKDPENIKMLLGIVSDLERELKEQKTAPRGSY